MGRTMPTECEHGAIMDWGDFGAEDGSSEPEFCAKCVTRTTNQDQYRSVGGGRMTPRERATEVLREFLPQDQAMEMAEAVLAVIAPHESSDEGTCWCPVAEAAGRERDAWKDRAERAEDNMECELCDHNFWHLDDSRNDECGHTLGLGPMCTFQVCGRCYNALGAENDRLREELGEAQLRSIEARNPGIDMDEVRRLRAPAAGDGGTA